jgi:hypothetical protein
MQTQPGAQSTELPLSRAEWELLVRLPRHVMLAVAKGRPQHTGSPHDLDTPGETSAMPDTAAAAAMPDTAAVAALPDTVAVAALPDTAAADAAVDAGRQATSQLVRGVVAVIRSEETPAGSYTDRAVDQAGVLSECHIAAQILHDRLSLADATAYQDWLLSVAGCCAPDEEFHDGLKRALTFT